MCPEGPAISIPLERFCNAANIRMPLSSRILRACLCRAVQQEVLAAASQAAENLKFLEVLRGPCQALREAESHQIPAAATKLLMAVRIVATHSKYYTTPDRIGGNQEGPSNLHNRIL